VSVHDVLYENIAVGKSSTICTDDTIGRSSAAN
jgi:hypothetical protein